MVQEAYKLWLQFDVRTDDITMTVLYFEDMDGLEEAHKACGRRDSPVARQPDRRASGRKLSIGQMPMKKVELLAAPRRESAAGLSASSTKLMAQNDESKPVRSRVYYLLLHAVGCHLTY